MIKWITIILAIAGLAAGLYTVATSGRDLPERKPDRPPATNPFESAVAATGLVEAASRNINVAAPERGLVTEVHVQVTDMISVDQPLFQVDPRPLQAALTEARAQVEVEQERYDRLAAEPRPEDIPVLEAQVAAAEAQLQVERNFYELAKQLMEKDAETVQEFNRQKAQYEAAQARLHALEAELTRLKAGAWQKRLEVARAAVAAAKARVEALNIRLDRLTVRSPIDGTVLKREVEPGEFVVPGEGQPHMVIGDLSTLHVRAKVNEEDMPRVREGAAAVARIRGPVRERIDLRMIRIEPLAQPKRTLTGVTTELVDTRIVEIVFEMTQPSGVPVYPGQIVDVFIKAVDTGAGEQGNGDVTDKK